MKMGCFIRCAKQNFLFMICGLKKGSEERSERGRRGREGTRMDFNCNFSYHTMLLQQDTADWYKKENLQIVY